MPGHWESVQNKIDQGVYGKAGKIGLKTRREFGSALDNFNTTLETPADKRAEINKAIERIEQPELRDKFTNSMTQSTTASYDKLKNTLEYERGLLSSAQPSSLNDMYDSFVPQKVFEISDAKLVENDAAEPTANSDSYNDALDWVQSLASGKRGY